MAATTLRFLTLLLLLATPILAVDSATAPFFTDQEWGGGAARPAGGGGGSLLSIGLSVLAVSGLAVGLGWLVRRTGLRRLLPVGQGHLQVIDRLALGRRRALLLVKCGDRLFLVGDHEHGLNACGEMPADGVSELVFSKQLLAAQHQPAP